MQLWFRNVDESGTTLHGSTNWDSDKIIQFFFEILKTVDRIISYTTVFY